MGYFKSVLVCRHLQYVEHGPTWPDPQTLQHRPGYESASTQSVGGLSLGRARAQGNRGFVMLLDVGEDGA